MARYDYQCTRCKLEIEITKSIHEYKTPEECPKCGAEMIKKFNNSHSFHLKGTGWYETDYKKRGK